MLVAHHKKKKKKNYENTARVVYPYLSSRPTAWTCDLPNLFFFRRHFPSWSCDEKGSDEVQMQIRRKPDSNGSAG